MRGKKTPLRCVICGKPARYVSFHSYCRECFNEIRAAREAAVRQREGKRSKPSIIANWIAIGAISGAILIIATGNPTFLALSVVLSVLAGAVELMR